MADGTSNLGEILRYMGPYRRRLYMLFGLTIVLSILAMCPPLITRAIIDKVLTDGETDRLAGLAILMISIPLLAALARFIQTVGIAYVGQHFVFDIRIALYNHLLGMSLRFFGDHSVGKLVNRLMGDSGMVQRMLTAQSINIISDLICATFAITVTFAINWRLATLLTLIVIVFVANYRFNIRKIKRATRGTRAALDRLSGGVQNRLVSNLAVKTFGAEEREQLDFEEHSDSALGLSKEAMVATNTFSMNTQLIQGLGRSTIYFLGCAMVLRGDLSYGDVVAFTAYAMQLLGPAVRFSAIVKQLQDVSIATERLFEIFGELPEITSKPGAKRIRQLEGKVDLEDVHFHYLEGQPVIQGLTLHVKPGQTVALIGPTGCGKSTVLSLLMRFFDICEGKLLLDGTDIRDLHLPSLRRQFGIVLQEPLLFEISLADNIRYGRPGTSMEAIQDAAKVAEIHDFIMTLPDGYDTILGRKGVDLSVGQKQRVTIARAVAADPAILIMDEATSALDSDSEQAIQRAMERVLKGRTSFVVAH
ncbi:MAG: ABC transporter ATP-binding protein, partial [Lentisphaeria bacterium]|nr:ABC transporter ATP-binding protein [Lentisphaeria bacterium]